MLFCGFSEEVYQHNSLLKIWSTFSPCFNNVTLCVLVICKLPNVCRQVQQYIICISVTSTWNKVFLLASTTWIIPYKIESRCEVLLYGYFLYWIYYTFIH